MKLDNKKTVLVGFAFLAISAFWQMYDSIIPLILKYFFRNRRYSVRRNNGS